MCINQTTWKHKHSIESHTFHMYRILFAYRKFINIQHIIYVFCMMLDSHEFDDELFDANSFAVIFLFQLNTLHSDR